MKFDVLVNKTSIYACLILLFQKSFCCVSNSLSNWDCKFDCSSCPSEYFWFDYSFGSFLSLLNPRIPFNCLRWFRFSFLAPLLGCPLCWLIGLSKGGWVKVDYGFFRFIEFIMISVLCLRAFTFYLIYKYFKFYRSWL